MNEQFIYKYKLFPGCLQTFRLPAGAMVCTFAAQGNDLCIWVQVNPMKRTILRAFEVVPTGGMVPTDGEYVGTALMSDGALVWHLYEVPA